jgi:hypothetical protein
MDKIVEEAQQWLGEWTSNINGLKINKVVDNKIFLGFGEYDDYDFEIHVQQDGSFTFELSGDNNEAEFKFVFFLIFSYHISSWMKI